MPCVERLWLVLGACVGAGGVQDERRERRAVAAGGRENSPAAPQHVHRCGRWLGKWDWAPCGRGLRTGLGKRHGATLHRFRNPGGLSRVMGCLRAPAGSWWSVFCRVGAVVATCLVT